MKTVLQINTSLFRQQGQSSRLGAALVAQLLGPADRLITRDLAADQVPHLTAERFAAFTTAEANRSAEQRAVIACSDALIGELRAGKKAYVLTTRGGHYQGTPMDAQTPFVRIFLGFLGITDVEFVYAEGLARGEAQRAQALDEANASIVELAA